MKHSPEIALRAAIRERSLAEEVCPHWDYEGGPYNGCDCCYALDDAQAKVRKLRAAIAKARGE